MEDLQALEAQLLSGANSSIYEGHCYIDPATRVISIPSEETLFGVESDEESHRVYFYTSKVVGDNFDLSKARVQINFKTPNNEIGVYLVQDLQVDGDFVTFSWSIRRMVTQYRGEVAFVVCATIPGGGDIDKEWNTTVAKGRVLEGIEAQGQVETIKEDLLGQLIAAADEASNAVEWAVNSVESAAAESVDRAVTEITEKGENQKKQISVQGEQTLKSIPTEYTALYNQVQQNTLEVSRSAPGIIQSASGNGIVSVSDSAERTLSGMSVYGKTTQDGTPTPEAPIPLANVGAGGSITVKVQGKNLMPSLVGTPGGVVSGVTVTRNADGTVTFDGTATASGYVYLTTYSSSYDKGIRLPAGTYRVTNGHTGNFDGVSQNLWYRVGVYRDGKTINGTNTFPRNLTIADGDTFESYIQLKEGETYNNLTFKPMICSAGTFTDDYEPYKDGGSMTALAPNGLPGLPVTSGGNYIDSTGQQWVCDEIDYVRKMHVRRVGQIHLKGTETISSLLSRDNSVRVTMSGYANAASGTLQYSNRLTHKSVYSQDVVGFVVANNNSGSLHLGLPLAAGTTISAVSAWIAAHPIDIHYVLDTPVETPLSPEELTGSTSLTAQYPNTTAFNDAGAGMKMEYIADTKIYIDQRIAALLNA